ncbi:C13 family peptidase [Uliginosibacterium sp. H3]|uniref:C13 family peptidase n=1 Tax=Uliginosibacterium silvisoli TaxID=3114758 RepID=A0ABU6JZ90_9RHOO|nr:C13 family peptidase [Uliginosibacterium sp. H3]
MTDPDYDQDNTTHSHLASPTGPAELVVEVDTSLEERVALLRASGARLKPTGESGLRPQNLLVMLLCWAVIGGGISQLKTWPMLGMVIILAGVLVTVLLASRQRFLLLARKTAAQYRIAVQPDGLFLTSDNGDSRIPWSAVESIESRVQVTLIFLRNYHGLSIPHRCFASEAAREEFVAALGQHATTATHVTAAPVAVEPTQTSFFRPLVDNLLAGLLLLCLRRSATRHLHASVPQLVGLVTIPILAGLASDLLRAGLDGSFNGYALTGSLYGPPWLLLAAWLAARIADNPSTALRAAVGVQAMWCWMAVLAQGLGFLPETAWQTLGSAAMLVWWFPFAYGMFATVPALVRSTDMPPEQRVGAILIVMCLLALPMFLVPRNQPMWVANEHEPESTAEQRERWEAPTREAILYSQPRLLAEAMAQVKPGQPGKPELFLLSLGGHGSQDVFMREVKSVNQLFAERFGTAGHSAVLLNNPTTLNEYPLASVTALDEALHGIGERMNRDEDVLLLFMTSHGGDDFRFDISMWPFKFDDLTPQRLKTALDKAGIRHRVVIVSSCYSGGFVPPLADANTWVMTAARADRNSHGCSHEADWTFFGRAFFDEALRKTRSLEEAFDMAKQAIAEREKAEGLTPSEPQVGGGETVKPLLRRITQASGS